MKRLTLLFCICLAVVSFRQLVGAQEAKIRKTAASNATRSDREQDGLNGPVRRVRVETAKIVVKEGKPIEGSRVVRGITTYDINGRKIDTVAYPVEGSAPSGKEQYRYDDKGNITEMVVRGNDGSILSKEIYQYEFDELGNWKKMTTSVAVSEDGKQSFESVEVTYRTITYYYGQAIDKIATASAAKPSSGSPSVSPVPAKSVSGPQTAAGATTRESKTVRNGKATEVLLGTDGNRSGNKNAVTSTVSPAPEDGTSAKNSSIKTAETPAASVETPPVAPAKMPVTPSSSAGIPAAVSQTESADKNGKATAPNGGASHPNSDTGASSRTDSAALSVAPSVLSSEDASSSYKQGLSYLRAGRYTEAVDALRQAVDRNPEDALAHTKLGLAYCALRQYKETVAVLKLAIKIKPEAVDAEAYYRLGEAYSALDKQSEALKAFKQAMYIARAQVLEPDPTKYNGFPTAPDLHYGLGLVYHKMGSYKEAIKEFKQAIDLKPEFAEAYYGLALGHIGLDDRKSAEKEEKILRRLNAALADKVAAAINSSSILAPGLTNGVLTRRP